MISSDTIGSLIKSYCRESGVRNLQKHIEKVTEREEMRVFSVSEQLRMYMSYAHIFLHLCAIHANYQFMHEIFRLTRYSGRQL